MTEVTITLTGDEREYLTTLLETVLKEKRVEEHRTRTPTFREDVLRQESFITSLLSKLGKTNV
jgi:hypothetical protein